MAESKTGWIFQMVDWNMKTNDKEKSQSLGIHGWFMSMYGKNHYNIVK